jgi:hypothetical protein
MTYELRDISIKFQLRIKWSPLKKAEVIGSRIRMGMRAFRYATWVEKELSESPPCL